MARIRTIKPSFFNSEDVSELPLRARLTWIGLWTHCDDQGRTKDNVKLIKAAVWPLDNVSLRDVEEDLATLADHGRIVRYQVGGRRYLAVVNWHEHQKINKPTPSRIPPPPKDGGPPPNPDPEGLTEDSGSTPGEVTEPSGKPPEGKGREGKGEEGISPRARVREATRWLRDRYRLTDDEAQQVIGEVQARARIPIKHLIPYLDGMAEGDLADIVAVVMDPEQPADPLPPIATGPPWCGHCDERTRQLELPDGRLRRCPDCHPLREDLS